MSDFWSDFDVIRRPDDTGHVMRLKPVRKRVRVMFGDAELARTNDAVRLLEIGHDIYDPVIYVPRDALLVDIERARKTTHCPLKGDASYYDVILPDRRREDDLVWSYESTVAWAEELRDLLAFTPDRVTMIEEPR
jgi:uncharacterized protein (DUF427 family)